MEKNRELILKYLSELMTNKEKNDFENNLINDLELKKEYEYIKNSLNIDKELFDEKYFINLLPKVRERINESSQYFKKKYLFAFSSLAFSLLLIFVFTNDIKKQTSEGTETVIENTQDLSQYFQEVDDETKAKYFDILTTQPISIELSDTDGKNEVLQLYDIFPDELTVYNSLSEKELNKIINELK